VIADQAIAVYRSTAATERGETLNPSLAVTLATVGRCSEAAALMTGIQAEHGVWLAEEMAAHVGDYDCAAKLAVINLGKRSPATIARDPWQYGKAQVLAGARLRRGGREAEGKALIAAGYGALREGAPVDPAIWERKRQELFWEARLYELARYLGSPLAMPAAEIYGRELVAKPDWAEDESTRAGFVAVLAMLGRQDLVEPLLPGFKESRGGWEGFKGLADYQNKTLDRCLRLENPAFRPVAAPSDADLAAALAQPTAELRLWKLQRLAVDAADAAACAGNP
jgi:hypothetical protein